MEFVIFWLGTSITCLYMNTVNGFRLYKDAADQGYKIDLKKFIDMNNNLGGSGKFSSLSMFIPIYNIIKTFRLIESYNQARSSILNSLDFFGVLEEMSDLEKEIYQEKPTGLNAIFAPLKAEFRIGEASSIKIKGENGDSEIFFEFDELDEIKILKVTGEASKWSLEEQKQRVIESLEKVAYGDNVNYIDEDEIQAKNDTKNVNSTEKLTTNNPKEDLEKLRNDLLELIEEKKNDERKNTNIKSVKGRSYTKKRK